MTAGKHNFTIEKEATFQRTLTWRDSSGDLVNLTGFSAQMKIYGDGCGDAPALTLTTTPDESDNVLTLGGAAGTIVIFISDETTSSLDFSNGSYVLKVTDSLGNQERLLEGVITVSPEGH